MKILIVKTSSLGDCLHCLPVLADIRALHADAEVHWVAEEAFVPLISLNPMLNMAIPVALRRWRQQFLHPQNWHELRYFVARLRAHHYDFVMDTQGLIKSAGLVALSRAQCKVGYSYACAREPWASWMYDKGYAIAKELHAVTRNRTLVALALGSALPTTLPDYGLHIEPKPMGQNYVMLLHGTSRSAKQWPVEHWIALAKALVMQQITPYLPWGTLAERDTAYAVANAVQHSVVLPKMDLLALASVIAGAKASVGVDSGLAHLSAAVHTPTIGIYTQSMPALTGLSGLGVYVNLGAPGVPVLPQQVLKALGEFVE